MAPRFLYPPARRVGLMKAGKCPRRVSRAEYRSVDDETGAVTFGEAGIAETYGVVDEIARQTLLAGGRVVSARRADVPGGGDLAAVLRYAV